MDYREISLGDQVRIRQWDEMTEEFGLSRRGGYPPYIRVAPGTVFVSEMRDLCGKTATVSQITKERVTLKFSSETRRLYRTCWTYTPGMLEPVEAPATCSYKPEDLSFILFAAAR